jgi:hypothetical protein
MSADRTSATSQDRKSKSRFRCMSGHTADITAMAGFGPTAAIRQLILL